MYSRSVEIRLKGRSYDCFIQGGDIMTIHKEIPLQAEAWEIYYVPRLSGLWLRIAAILAERGELGV